MMEIERIIVHKRKPMPNKMHLGFEGDNMVRRIAFDLPEVSDAQTATLMYGGKYADMISLVKDGGQWVADLTAEMIGAAGEVEGYVRVDGPTGEVWHSDILRIVTGDVPAVEVQIEKLYPTAVDQMLTEIAKYKTEMDAAVERAETAADRAESAGGGGGSGGSGGITQETDPTVPVWAKQPEKPTYTADEVGALAADAPVVRYAAQELTEEQQEQARANVGAQPAGDYALKTDIPEPYNLPTASATVKGGVKVGKGLEMDGEALGVVPEGEYELIEKITVDTEISLLSRSQEPDGKEYDFKKIYIDIKTPQGSEKKVGVVSLNSAPVVPIAYMNSMIETNENGAWGKIFAHIDVNVLRGYAACSVNGDSQLTWTNANVYMRGFGEIGITGIYYMQFSIISGKIPVGTVVEIWGVRANA